MKKNIIMLATIIAVGMTSCKTKGHVHSHSAAEDVDYTKAYSLIDEGYGTETKVSIKKGQRVMETNALPNHETGNFPNKGNPNTIKAQQQKYTFPVEPKFSGRAQRVKEPGVALNGIKFDPGTNERVECETGEVYRIEAIQEFDDLGLDFNNAHVQPTGAYHYHGVSKSLVEKFDKGGDLVHVGYALDGYRIMYSKSGAYKPGYKLSTEARKGTLCVYENPHNKINTDLDGTMPDGRYTSDWVYNAENGNLDECNGIEVNGEYIYLITETYPFVSRCLMGEFTEARRGPGPGEGRPPRGQGGAGRPPRPEGGRN